MGLTAIQYRDIMNEYDQLRRDNYQKQQDNIQEIYRVIPEIRNIDDYISSESIATAKRLLFQPGKEAKEELHRKIEESTRKKTQLLLDHGYASDYLDPIYHCFNCKDTGYVNNHKCFCFEQRILSILMEQSNLMDSVKENNFHTFSMKYYSDEIPAGESLSPRENMQKVLDSCFHFIRDLESNPGQNLLIQGNPGVGKTFLSTCIASEVIKSGKSVIYLTSYQLFEQLANYTFHRKEGHTDTMSLLMDTDLLIIDDLGTEMNNSFNNSQLFQCINERILSKKSTIINTNFNLKQLSTTYTERISSRLIEFYTILHIFGEDIRIKKAFSPIDECP